MDIKYRVDCMSTINSIFYQIILDSSFNIPISNIKAKAKIEVDITNAISLKFNKIASRY